MGKKRLERRLNDAVVDLTHAVAGIVIGVATSGAGRLALVVDVHVDARRRGFLPVTQHRITADGGIVANDAVAGNVKPMGQVVVFAAPT